MSGIPGTTLPPVDAVVLDAGGVLLVPDPTEVRRLFAPHGVSPDDELCLRAHYESMRELDRIDRVDWAAIDVVYGMVLGLDEAAAAATVAVVEELYQRRPFVPIAGVVEALRALEREYPLAVVSNATGSMEQMLAVHRICAVDGSAEVAVAIVVDSAVVGIEKPDPRIFAFALDELGVAPDRALYVGDSVHFDVNGATAAGMPVVHIDPFDLCPHDDHPHAAGLAEVATLLGIGVGR